MSASRGRPDLRWQGEAEDDRAAHEAAVRRAELAVGETGEVITIANEFAEVRVVKVETRNGARLLVESPRSGQWVSLCPLELESLTWQSPHTFSAMIGHPFGPLVEEDP